jgi:hypothetical protein
MIRRSFLRKLAAVPFFAATAAIPAATSQVKLKILMKSTWGSDDPTFVSLVEWADKIITE